MFYSKKGRVTWPGSPVGAIPFANATNAVSSGQDRNATEAAGFGDRRPQIARRAIRVCATPRPGLQGFHLALCAALAAARSPAEPVSVTPVAGMATVNVTVGPEEGTACLNIQSVKCFGTGTGDK